jgi:hypothetical protein
MYSNLLLELVLKIFGTLDLSVMKFLGINGTLDQRRRIQLYVQFIEIFDGTFT